MVRGKISQLIVCLQTISQINSLKPLFREIPALLAAHSTPNLGVLVVICRNSGHHGEASNVSSRTRRLRRGAFAVGDVSPTPAGRRVPLGAVSRERGSRGGHGRMRRGRASFTSWRSPRSQCEGDSKHSPTSSCSPRASLQLLLTPGTSTRESTTT